MNCVFLWDKYLLEFEVPASDPRLERFREITQNYDRHALRIDAQVADLIGGKFSVLPITDEERSAIEELMSEGDRISLVRAVNDINKRHVQAVED